MLLGNCTSAVALGLNTVLEDLTTHCAAIEWQLAMGANRCADTSILSYGSISMSPTLYHMGLYLYDIGYFWTNKTMNPI